LTNEEAIKESLIKVRDAYELIMDVTHTTAEISFNLQESDSLENLDKKSGIKEAQVLYQLQYQTTNTLNNALVAIQSLRDSIIVVRSLLNGESLT
jgi:hypothetical protein